MLAGICLFFIWNPFAAEWFAVAGITTGFASVQLDLVRRVLQDDLRHVADEERDGADGPRATSWSWDAPRTAYFHLLTSQWGPIVKPLSDGAAWVRRQAFRRRRRG